MPVYNSSALFACIACLPDVALKSLAWLSDLPWLACMSSTCCLSYKRANMLAMMHELHLHFLCTSRGLTMIAHLDCRQWWTLRRPPKHACGSSSATLVHASARLLSMLATEQQPAMHPSGLAVFTVAAGSNRHNECSRTNCMGRMWAKVMAGTAVET